MSFGYEIALPKSWSWSPLKFATTLLSRGTAPDYTDDGPVRAISQAANQPAGLDWKRTRFHNHSGNPRRLKGYLLPGDVLINSTGTGTLGRVGYFDAGPDDLPCIADGHVTVARADRRIAEPKYMYYWLSSTPFQDYIYSALTVGATNQIELHRERLAGSPVALPAIDEQRRIANFLDAETARIDHLTKLRDSQLKSLGVRMENYLSQLADDLCIRYGMVRVRHVLQKIEQGWSPQCEDRLSSFGEWGVVKSGCVNGGVFDITQHKTLPAAIAPVLRYRLRAGDLLMSRASGSVDLIGSIAVLPVDLPPNLLLCDKVYRLRMDRTRMSPPFVALMLRTHRVREQIKLGISGADGMANNLPTATVTNLPIPDVPLAEQSHIVNDLQDRQSAIREARLMLENQLSLLAERRQALLTAVVTGQIDVTTARALSSFQGAYP
jgi:type I restriction enzyme S subunit